MKAKKIVYFALAALVLLVLIPKTWGMQPRSPSKFFLRPDIVFCFQDQWDTGSLLPTSSLQQKLSEGYGDNVIQYWMRVQPESVRKNLFAWYELAKNTEKTVFNQGKLIQVSGFKQPLRDLTQDKNFKLLVRSVQINKNFAHKLRVHVAQFGIPPDFTEGYYRSCSLIDHKTATFGSRWFLYVLAVTPPAILHASPYDVFSDRDKVVECREYIADCKKQGVCFSPDEILKKTAKNNYNEIVVLTDPECPRNVHLVAFALQKTEWENYDQYWRSQDEDYNSEQCQLIALIESISKHSHLPILLIDTCDKE